MLYQGRALVKTFLVLFQGVDTLKNVKTGPAGLVLTTGDPAGIYNRRQRPDGVIGAGDRILSYNKSGHGMKFFLCVIGMVMIIEGLPYFAFPEKIKHWLEQMLEMNPSVLRLFGLALMTLGLCLVYLGRH
jgi:hypothetical protein